MKNLSLLMIFLLATACGGGSSGSKAGSTNGGKQVTTTQGGQALTNGGTTGGGTNLPGGTSPSTADHTPMSHGYGLFPSGELSLEFDVATNGGAYAQGQLVSNQDVGYGDCLMPAGNYAITTLQPGSQKIRVHNYGGISLQVAGSKSIQLLLENSLSMQNSAGEWVMYAKLKLVKVANKDCSGSYITLSYSMPTL